MAKTIDRKHFHLDANSRSSTSYPPVQFIVRPTRFCRRAVERRAGPRIGRAREPPVPKAPENLCGYTLFVLDNTLKRTGKMLLLDGNALM